MTSTDPALNQLVDDYRHGEIGRREFLRRAAAVLGSAAAAVALFNAACTPAPPPVAQATPAPVPSPTGTPVASPSPTAAQGVPAEVAAIRTDPNDPALDSRSVSFPAAGRPLAAYLSRPRAGGPFPVVIVVHASSGVDAHLQDVARRLAKEGFAGLVPELVARTDGRLPEGVPAAMRRERTRVMAELVAAVEYARSQDFARGQRAGTLGFCVGGDFAFLLGTESKEIRATVMFYGRNPDPMDRVQRLSGGLFAAYGGDDTGVTQQQPELEAALARFAIEHETKVYPGAPHAFHEDSRADRYRHEAARDAWSKTLALFQKHLRP